MSNGPCSACGRAQPAVSRFFAARPGGNAALSLCDRCLDECTQVMEDLPTRIPGNIHECAYCGKDENDVSVVIGIGERKICNECVDAYSA